jgi:hypothetical protein
MRCRSWWGEGEGGRGGQNEAGGAQVRVDRRGPGFTRLAVTVADGRSVVVEIAHDARIRESLQLSFGGVLHPDAVAADMTLALFGRAAARDLVDMAALSGRYTLEQLCELATEKDAGFDRRGLRRRLGRGQLSLPYTRETRT